MSENGQDRGGGSAAAMWAVVLAALAALALAAWDRHSLGQRVERLEEKAEDAETWLDLLSSRVIPGPDGKPRKKASGQGAQ